MHRRASLVMSGLMIALGLGIVGRTLAGGGGPIAVGLVLGVLFCLAGAGRLYIEGRR